LGKEMHVNPGHWSRDTTFFDQLLITGDYTH
jgi:hypothetical protein